MRPVKRIEPILKLLELIWKEHPDFRLGQLIGNVLEGPALYYIEDEDLVKYVAQYYGHDLEKLDPEAAEELKKNSDDK